MTHCGRSTEGASAPFSLLGLMRYILLVMVAFACGNPCSVPSLKETIETKFDSEISPGLEPKFMWGQDSALGGNITLLRGDVTMNTLAGPRRDYPVTARVWCDGSSNPEVTMLYVTNFMNKEFNEAGRDTAMTNSAMRIEAMTSEELSGYVDSLLAE